MMTKKILNMSIEEVSAVDKAATGKKFLIVKHEDAQNNDDQGGETVMTFEELLEKVEDEEVKKGFEAVVEDREETIEDLEKRVEELEKADETDEGDEDEEDINKSELPEEVREQLEKMEDEVNTAKEMAQIEKKKRLEVEFNKRAEKFNKVGEVDKTARILMKASELFDEDTYEDLKTILKSAQARLEEADIDVPEGEDGGGDATDPVKKLEDKAEELAKSNDISKEQAFAKALELNPELYREYIESAE